jgi:two-component system, NtrC family, sensor kinase
MKRRSKASGKPARPRRSKSSKSKGRAPTNATSNRTSGGAANTEVVQLRRELHEALEQQTATSEVLQVISSSPGDLESIFTIMLKNAVRICDAHFGNIYLFDGEYLHLAAQHNTPIALANERQRTRAPYRSDPRLPLGP